tara:strand:- start:1125 stop:2588 length:1464 start_codon:yes stop_codon:yes gene_type:complete
MANTTETATFNVKSNIGEVTKDAAGLAGEFKIMGVSLNSVKAGFVSVGKTAKASFATIKAGIMSTGIGALLIAVTSLISYFTNTKRGADQLDRAFTAMGATIDVLKDRLSKVGEALSFVFSGEFKKAGEALKGTFSGIADEVEREVAAMVALKKRTQELRDADMEFMVQKAKTRQEIEKARLIAEDETKSASERLENLKKALELEAETTQAELVLARERMKIQEEEMALSENSAEDEQELARLKTEIIEKETASIKMRRRVVTEVNALEREIHAEETARRKESMVQVEEMTNLFEKNINKRLEMIGQLIKAEEISFEKTKIMDSTLRELSEERVEWDAMTLNERLNLTKNTLNDLTTIAGEQTEVGRALAITSTTIATYQSAQESYKALAGIPVIGPVLGGVAAAAAVAMGLKNIQAIAGAGSSGITGGSNTPSAVTAPQTPAPQMMSGAFELTGGQAPEPLRAFVLTDEMTNSQNQLANIRRRATI